MEARAKHQPRKSRFLAFRTVKGKLLIVFGLIVGLSMAIGSIGWRGFSDTEQALKSLREESLPDLGNAMDLARASAGIAAVAPFLSSIEVMNKLNAEQEKLDKRIVEFRSLVNKLEPAGVDGVKATPGSLRDLAARLEADLRDLVQNTREGLGVRSDMLELGYAFKGRAAIEKWLQDNAKEVDGSGERLRAFRRLIETVLSAVAENNTATLAELGVDYDHLAAMVQVDASRTEIASGAVELRDFVRTQSQVFELRHRQLAGYEQTQFLLASIHALSTLLSERVSELALRTMQRSKASSAETNAALENGKYRILILIGVSLLVGVAAASYVLRNLAGNLRAVTTAMSRLAGGDRDTTVPGMDRVDELGSLARAFNIFKEQSFDREVLTTNLIEKSRMLEATFTNMTDGMSVFDTVGQLVAWNPQFIEINELDPNKIRSRMHFREVFELLMATGVKFLGENETTDAEQLFRRRQTDAVAYLQNFPSKRVVELRSAPMDGGFATMYTDLTERRAMEEQLRQAQRMEAVGQLTSGMAHDFNNILAAVSGSLQMLQEALHDRADLTPRVLRALEATERGATLTQRLLAFSRQQALQPELTDLNSLVRGLLELLDYDIGKEIVVETDLDAALDEVFVDQVQLENAVLNLIFNSRDALPEGGKISIRTSNAALHAGDAMEKYVSVSVSDNGIGMAPDVAARVFEPFFTTKEKGQGSGLGLSMVYGFVNQSGGEVQIASELGNGTTVTFSLPKSGHARPSRRHLLQPPSAATPIGGNERVLIVEDDRIVRETAVDILASLGYETEVASDLEQAEAQLSGSKFDLLFTDYILPNGKTGDDVAAFARKVNPDIPILYTSGFPLDKFKKNRLLAEKAVLIAKPFRTADLANTVRQLLDGRGSTPKRSTSASKR